MPKYFTRLKHDAPHLFQLNECISEIHEKLSFWSAARYVYSILPIKGAPPLIRAPPIVWGKPNLS